MCSAGHTHEWIIFITKITKMTRTSIQTIIFFFGLLSVFWSEGSLTKFFPALRQCGIFLAEQPWRRRFYVEIATSVFIALFKLVLTVMLSPLSKKGKFPTWESYAIIAFTNIFWKKRKQTNWAHQKFWAKLWKLFVKDPEGLSWWGVYHWFCNMEYCTNISGLTWNNKEHTLKHCDSFVNYYIFALIQ